MVNGKKPPMAVRIVAVVAGLALGLLGGLLIVALLSGGGNEGSQGTQEAKQTQEVQQEAADGAQVFETVAATVEYRDTQDVAGNAMVTFSLTNATDRTVMVTGENVVVNGQYAAQALGGSTVPIGPGETGAVSLSFGAQVQTPLSGTSDMETLSCDLVLLDNDSLTTELARVPVSVTL